MTRSIVVFLGGLVAGCAGRVPAPDATLLRTRVIVQLPPGAAEAQAGIVGGDVDGALTGPNAITAGGGGQLYVLDNVNGRVLRIDRATGVTTPVPVEGLTNPIDLVWSGKDLYVWDRSARRISIPSGGKAALAGPAENALAPDDAGAVRDRFEEFGHDVSPEVGRRLEERQPMRPARSMLAADGTRRLLETHREGDRRATVRVDAAGGGTRDLVVETRGPLGAVRLLAVDSHDRAYVLIEETAAAEEAFRVATSLVRFGPTGAAPEATYRLPIAEVDFLPNRFVAVSDDGGVYFLRVMRTGTTVEQVAPSASADAPDAAPLRAPASSPSAEIRAFERKVGGRAGAASLQAISPRSRTQILDAAAQFATQSWMLGEANYRADETSQCSPPTRRWLRPRRLEGRMGGTIVGLPYNWGGFDSPTAFEGKLAGGAPAGNVCTCRQADCVRQDAAGVDCSGFVSRVWGVPRCTTSSIGSVSTPVPRSALKPGDALNKPGSHIRLFVAWGADPGFIRTYESSVSCGGVCLRDLPLSQFDGYSGLERQAVTE